jgi:UDP-2,3-diacylglucosamine hydrolase
MNQTGDPYAADQADLFISDLHLCASRPHITQDFLKFLKSTAKQARALYLLGDVFEYWAGDDDLPSHQAVVDGLRDLADAGVAVYLMHGNRDFLIGQAFCVAAKLKLLPDPCVIDLHGVRTLISHGDALCSDDLDYQAFRLKVRDKNWQTAFLQRSLTDRKEQIAAMRAHSEQEKSHKASDIMDINPQTLSELLRAHDYPERVIHGHTHRPMKHDLSLDGHAITRWVLADWYEQGSYLTSDASGCQYCTIAQS